MQAIPYAGGVLSGTATFFLERQKNERLNKFLLKLADELNQLRDKLNSDFIKSDEFQDLTEDVFSKAAETRQQGKLDALRAIFLNIVLSDHPKYEETEEITSLIESWQDRHIIILKILSDPQAADAEMGNIVGDGGNFGTSISDILSKLLPAWSENEIERTWKDLYDKGMHQIPGIKTIMTDKGIHQLDGRLTEFGLTVSRYIKNPVENK